MAARRKRKPTQRSRTEPKKVRSAVERRRQAPQTFVPRARLEALFGLPVVDYGALRKHLDAAVDQDPWPVR
jgi:hypothetical protein